METSNLITVKLIFTELRMKKQYI